MKNFLRYMIIFLIIFVGNIIVYLIYNNEFNSRLILNSVIIGIIAVIVIIVFDIRKKKKEKK